MAADILERICLAVKLVELVKPGQIACVRSLNDNCTNQCLNEHWFTNLAGKALTMDRRL